MPPRSDELKSSLLTPKMKSLLGVPLSFVVRGRQYDLYVHNEKDNDDADPDYDDHIRIRGEVVRVKDGRHVNPHRMLSSQGGGTDRGGATRSAT